MKKKVKGEACLVKSHAILYQKTDTRIEKTDVALQDKVTLRLSRDARLEIPQTLLRFRATVINKKRRITLSMCGLTSAELVNYD